ncbi:hypothetical protein NEOLEDRAFT_1131133 [Neolentinus lepideus HHB14362 ss-1]|uniref:Uncharacterized protein n=1 Tax=Neolentinus lepideus HHB14362 ss-1 TaxID=1314782 RepID=A0A165TT48_9AGAM|nr:hypothetical protein NEOLEDRAFT_1131133 [Neolentinus lepideus HHB14362 ss-1]
MNTFFWFVYVRQYEDSKRHVAATLRFSPLLYRGSRSLVKASVARVVSPPVHSARSTPPPPLPQNYMAQSPVSTAYNANIKH